MANTFAPVDFTYVKQARGRGRQSRATNYGTGYGSAALPLSSAKSGKYLSELIDVDMFRRYIKTWYNATVKWRLQAKKDYEYVDSKQWTYEDWKKVTDSGRPALTFNKILPQVELMCGMQRGMETNFRTMPRGMQSRALAEISTASLRAAEDFTRLRRTDDRVFDDATICGLGVWKCIHSYEDAEDLIWGDVGAYRINPMAFIWDPWAVHPSRQDGLYMGDASWVSFQYLRDRYPDKETLIAPGEWIGAYGQIGDPRMFGLGYNLIPEIWDHETGRVRLMNLFYRKSYTISFIADIQTGQVYEVENKKMAESLLENIASHGKQALLKRYKFMQNESEHVLMDTQTGVPASDPMTNSPVMFLDSERGQQYLDRLADKVGVEVYSRLKVVSRKATKPHWVDMVWWQILDSGESPYWDRNYPYVMYVQRQFTDDPESIQGIVRPIRDSQDEYNKRYNNLLAHLNSSAHSGWLNRKAGGSNKSELQLMGSRPGIVVEYTTMAPQQIKPVEISQGHFVLLGTSDNNIKGITGINNELIGNTTQNTVSGRAIQARKAGGITILAPRFRTYEESKLDLGYMMLSRIQQFFPAEKLRRIIEIAETQNPLGQNGQSVIGGKSDEEVIQLLETMRNVKFDLVLALEPESPTLRQARFEQAIQMAGLITSSGRPIGNQTFAEMTDMADIPVKLAEAMKADMQQPVNPQVLQPGGQNQHMQGFIQNVRGGRAGGSEGVIGQPSGASTK